MYQGHLALALAARGMAPDRPLEWLLVASVWPDLVDPVLVLSGLSAPTAHSLLGLALWSTVLGGGVFAWSRSRGLTALCAALSCSHVLADLLTSQLTLWPGAPPFGLHAYQSRSGDFALEAGLSLVCWAIYRRTARSARAWPSFALLALLVTLQAIFDFGTRIG